MERPAFLDTLGHLNRRYRDRHTCVVPTQPDDDPTFPLKEHLGFEIEHGDATATATATIELDERHLNPHAMAHGAVAFTMMDTAMGAAVMSVVE